MFDPDAAGGVPFDPDAAGGTAFNPDTAGGVPHPAGLGGQLWAGAKEGFQGAVKTLLGGSLKDLSILANNEPAIGLNAGEAKLTPQIIQDRINSFTPGEDPSLTAPSPSLLARMGRSAAATATGGALLGPLGGAGPISSAIRGAYAGAAGQAASEVAPAGYENAANALTQLAVGSIPGPKNPSPLLRSADETAPIVQPTMDPETAQAHASSIRVANMLEDANNAASTSSGSKPSSLQVAGGVRDDIYGQLKAAVADIKSNDAITLSPGEKAVLDQLTNTATNHLADLTPSALSRVDDLPLPDNIKAYLKGTLADANTASTQRYSGVATGLGKTVGTWVGGHLLPVGGIGRGLGAMAGNAIDAAAGTQQAPVTAQAVKARMALQAVGIDPDTAGAPLARPGMPVAPIPGVKPLAPPPIQRPAPPLVGTPLAPPPIRAAAPPLVGTPLAPPPIRAAAPPLTGTPLAPPPIVPGRGPAPSIPLPAPPIVPGRGPAPSVPLAPPPIVPGQGPAPSVPLAAPPIIPGQGPAPSVPLAAPPIIPGQGPAPSVPLAAPPVIPGQGPAPSVPLAAPPIRPAGPNEVPMVAPRTPPPIYNSPEYLAAMAQRRVAQQGIPGISQPDPATGLPANVAPQGIAPALPARLQPDTPATVRQGLTMDQEFGPSPGAAPMQAAINGAPQTPGARYITGPGSDGLTTHQQAVNAAQAAETAGIVPAGTAAKVAFSQSPLDPVVGRKIQEFHTGQNQSDVGLPYSGAWRAQVATETYVKNADALALRLTTPGQREALANIRATPMISDKVAIADRLSATDPSVAEMIQANQWLLQTGGK